MTRANLLLVNPRTWRRPSNARLPLSLLSLAAVLEGRHDYGLVDGNVDPDPVASALDYLSRHRVDAIGMSVMPGPQIVQSITIARALRAAHPAIPIIWGGYFPTMYTEAALNTTYVDYAVRGPGEATLLDLIDRLSDAGAPSPRNSGVASAIEGVEGLSWKRDGAIVHNQARKPTSPDDLPPYPYARIADGAKYHSRSYLGRVTSVHQAAIGCRFRCSFCGVVSMFNGLTRLEGPDRLRHHLRQLRERFGADSLMFYDNNFFDTPATSSERLEVLAEARLPYWCFARADALAGFSDSMWTLVERSQLRMAFIGADAVDDETLRRMRKGTRVSQTHEAVAKCFEHGVVPELSFILGDPDDPIGSVERTLAFVRMIKHRYPRTEIILYYYSPTPQRNREAWTADPLGLHMPELSNYGPDGPSVPTTPEEWAEDRWMNYVCHTDAPWLTPELRARVAGFTRVLECRFPTVTDTRLPPWGKTTLRALARWRWSTGKYAGPWELDLARRFIPLHEPRVDSL